MPRKKQPSALAHKPVYVVCGPEPFHKRQVILEITNRILGKADRSLTLSEYDGSSPSLTLADVLDDVRTLPFLAEHRLVLVKDADPFITAHRADLEHYVDNPSPTGVLLLVCNTLAANTRLYKRVKAIGEVIKCEAVRSRDIPSWLAQRSQQHHGLQIDRQATTLLLELVGEDLGLLDGEVQKLALYVGDRRRVDLADVEAVVGQHREEKVWNILSAISAGNEARALHQWEDVWQTDRAASARAIGGLAFTVRRLLNAKRAQEAGAPLKELARMLIRWGDEQRLQRELSAFTTEQVESMLCRLLDADVASKTGIASVRSSIERFIIELCRSRKSRRPTG